VFECWASRTSLRNCEAPKREVHSTSSSGHHEHSAGQLTSTRPTIPPRFSKSASLNLGITCPARSGQGRCVMALCDLLEAASTPPPHAQKGPRR
jgi:hypothetical protein